MTSDEQVPQAQEFFEKVVAATRDGLLSWEWDESPNWWRASITIGEHEFCLMCGFSEARVSCAAGQLLSYDEGYARRLRDEVTGARKLRDILFGYEPGGAQPEQRDAPDGGGVYEPYMPSFERIEDCPPPGRFERIVRVVTPGEQGAMMARYAVVQDVKLEMGALVLSGYGPSTRIGPGFWVSCDYLSRREATPCPAPTVAP
jgi:hypothetical protein